MGKKLIQRKNENIGKIKIGFCIELLVIFNNFDDVFSRLNSLLSSNSELLDNQNYNTINQNLSNIQSVLDTFLDLILADIDKTEEFCNYSFRYY